MRRDGTETGRAAVLAVVVMTMLMCALAGASLAQLPDEPPVLQTAIAVIQTATAMAQPTSTATANPAQQLQTAIAVLATATAEAQATATPNLEGEPTTPLAVVATAKGDTATPMHLVEPTKASSPNPTPSFTPLPTWTSRRPRRLRLRQRAAQLPGRRGQLFGSTARRSIGASKGPLRLRSPGMSRFRRGSTLSKFELRFTARTCSFSSNCLEMFDLTIQRLGTLPMRSVWGLGHKEKAICCAITSSESGLSSPGLIRFWIHIPSSLGTSKTELSSLCRSASSVTITPAMTSVWATALFAMSKLILLGHLSGAKSGDISGGDNIHVPLQ